MKTIEILENAKRVKTEIALLSTADKRRALECMADGIDAHCADILRANAEDMRAARDKTSIVMLDRLALDAARVKAMSDGLREISQLPDPVGKIMNEYVRENGLKICKVAVPMGVVAVIYEICPNVTADAAGLALMSGNACILRIGKEAYRSARVIVDAMREGLKASGLSEHTIALVDDASRASADELMRAVGYVDVLVPRGGKSLIDNCVMNAKVPCIQTGTGICHVYVDGAADMTKALDIIENAKCSRPSVCNAMEVCLVDNSIAQSFLPKLCERLASNGKTPVKLKLDERAYAIIGETENCSRAEKDDFDTEFLDYVAAVGVVDGVNGAIKHISAHSTGHSDCIITEDNTAADLFLRAVDSAAVYVNASTRFTDGGEFGLCGEIGISTQKLHARGPMGLNELCTYKYIVIGNGQIRK